MWALATLGPTLLPFTVSFFNSAVSWLVNGFLTSRNSRSHEESNSTKSVKEDMWDWPIWHLPLLQLVNHFRLTKNILRATKIRNERANDLMALSDMKFINEQLVSFLKKKVGDKTLKHATNLLSRSEAEFLSTKLMEAAFESGPQFIIQLAIILKVGNVEAHQAATMLISLASFWFSSTKFCLQMPTKKTSLRSTSISDFAVVFIPTMVVILSRFTVWSFLTAYLGFQILIPVLLAFLYMIAIHRKTIDLTSKRDLVEIFANILVPCLSKDEYSGFYHLGSATTTTVLMASTMYIMFSTHAINASPPILTCFEPSDWTPMADDIRCYYSPTENRITKTCMPRLLNFGLGFGFDTYRSICHDQEQKRGVKQTMLYTAAGSLIAGLFLSQLLTTYCIQPFLDPLVRLKVAASWNSFYQTSADDVRFVIRADSQLSCTDWKIVLFSAIDDNIDSLAKYLVDMHNCDVCDQTELLQSGLQRCHDNNPQIKAELQRSLQAIQSQTSGGHESPANDGSNVVERKFSSQQNDELQKVSLDMKHCRASIDRLNRKLNGNKQHTPEESLVQLIRADDSTNVSHFLHCHKHLCTKAVEVFNSSVDASFDIGLLSKLVKISQQVQEEALCMPGSKVQIHLKYHNFWCQEMIQTMRNRGGEANESSDAVEHGELPPVFPSQNCPNEGSEQVRAASVYVIIR